MPKHEIYNDKVAIEEKEVLPTVIPVQFDSQSEFLFQKKLTDRQVLGRAYLSSNTTITDNTETVKVPIDTSDFTQGCSFSSTNNRITVNKSGYYRITASIGWNQPVDQSQYGVLIGVNGTMKTRGHIHASGTNFLVVSCSDLLNLVAGDYVELHAFHVSGADKNARGAQKETYLAVESI